MRPQSLLPGVSHQSTFLRLNSLFTESLSFYQIFLSMLPHGPSSVILLSFVWFLFLPRVGLCVILLWHAATKFLNKVPYFLLPHPSLVVWRLQPRNTPDWFYLTGTQQLRGWNCEFLCIFCSWHVFCYIQKHHMDMLARWRTWYSICWWVYSIVYGFVVTDGGRWGVDS